MTSQAMLDMFRRKGGARCIEIGRQIRTYLAGGLDPATAAKVSTHLQACRRCGLATEDHRRLEFALVEMSAPIPAGPLQRLQALTANLACGDTSPT